MDGWSSVSVGWVKISCGFGLSPVIWDRDLCRKGRERRGEERDREGRKRGGWRRGGNKRRS